MAPHANTSYDLSQRLKDAYDNAVSIRKRLLSGRDLERAEDNLAYLKEEVSYIKLALAG